MSRRLLDAKTTADAEASDAPEARLNRIVATSATASTPIAILARCERSPSATLRSASTATAAPAVRSSMGGQSLIWLP